MGTVDRLLKATEDIWASYHEKPFVQGLKYGTLDQKKFRSYIIQDYWYLMDYTKVFAIGVAKSKSVEVMETLCQVHPGDPGRRGQRSQRLYGRFWDHPGGTGPHAYPAG